MSRTEHNLTTSENTSAAIRGLTKAIREYVRAYVQRHGCGRVAEVFGVSHHTLWRFLGRGQVKRPLPNAFMYPSEGNVFAPEVARQVGRCRRCVRKKLIMWVKAVSLDPLPSNPTSAKSILPPSESY